MIEHLKRPGLRKDPGSFPTLQYLSFTFVKQTWADNMLKATEPKISPSSHGEDFTRVTFYPDLAQFKMTSLDKDIVDLFSRRAYDIAACSKGVKVFLNGKELPVSIQNNL